MRRVVLAVIAMCFSYSCLAELTRQSGPQVCRLLNDTQLRAGEWVAQTDGSEGCESSPRSISATSTDGNSISYVAEGTSGTPKRVKLILNISLPSDQATAKREMIKATKRLSVRTLGSSVPQSMVESIMNEKAVTLKVGSGVIALSRMALSKSHYVLTIVME